MYVRVCACVCVRACMCIACVCVCVCVCVRLGGWVRVLAGDGWAALTTHLLDSWFAERAELESQIVSR